MKMVTRSTRDTARLARAIAEQLHGGETLALVGPLGSGKTTFVKALARALGVRKPVRSPTFVLMVPYACRPAVEAKLLPRSLASVDAIRTLVHADAYRVKNARDLEAIGIREYLGRPDTVTVIEWADRVRTLLPKNTLILRFVHGKTPTERIILVGKSAVTKKPHIPRALTTVKRTSTLK